MILGVDPGYSGAIARLDPATGILEIEDMPVVKDKQGRSDLNLAALGQMMIPRGDGPHVAIIEKVHAMPNQGIASSFRFGEQLGALKMAALGLGYELHLPSPAGWKKHFGLSKKKDTSRGLAIQRFPAHADLFKRVKDDGRAEAALIALFGVETLHRFTSTPA